MPTNQRSMTQIVGGLAKWKLAVMFIVGLIGMGAIVVWFAFLAEEPDKLTLIAAAVMFGVFAFFAFPVGITRLADKFWPAKWRPKGPQL